MLYNAGAILKLVFLFAVFNSAVALNCFECEGVLGTNDNCNYIDLATVIRTCDDPLDFCMEYSYNKTNGQPILVRKCSGNDDCGLHQHREDTFCKICFQSKCNDYIPPQPCASYLN